MIVRWAVRKVTSDFVRSSDRIGRPARPNTSPASRTAAAIGGSTSGSGSATPNAIGSGAADDWRIAPQKARMSAAVCVKNPSVSRLFANGRTPSVDNSPNVPLKPVIPQYEAGRIVEPPVWVPIATGTIPAATAAAEPLELPPGVWARSRGLRVGAGWRY